MEAILIIICAILFANLVLLVTAFSWVAIFTRDIRAKKSDTVSRETTSAGMDEEAMKEFLEADREAAQGFHDAIAGLNAFMTGIEEEDPNVGQQDS